MISQSNTEEKGMTAISTLIIFIAIVLIAGIGANVLINVTDSLENQAQTSGQNTISEVSKQVDITDTYGITNGDGNVSKIVMNVRKTAGSDDVDLSRSTIDYLGATDQQVLTASDVGTTATAGEFNVSTFKDSDDSIPVINSDSDRINVSIPLQPSGSTPEVLTPGSEAEVTIDVAEGGTTTQTIDVPNVVESDSTVSLSN